MQAANTTTGQVAQEKLNMVIEQYLEDNLLYWKTLTNDPWVIETIQGLKHNNNTVQMRRRLECHALQSTLNWKQVGDNTETT